MRYPRMEEIEGSSRKDLISAYVGTMDLFDGPRVNYRWLGPFVLRCLEERESRDGDNSMPAIYADYVEPLSRRLGVEITERDARKAVSPLLTRL